MDILQGNEATTFGIVFYPSRQKRVAVYQFSASYPLTLQSLSHNEEEVIQVTFPGRPDELLLGRLDDALVWH